MYIHFLAYYFIKYIISKEEGIHSIVCRMMLNLVE
jgi:hypothetical protein